LESDLKQSRIDCGSKKSIGIQKYIGTNRVTLNSKPHWRRPATDPIVDFCIAKGIAIHGHPLVWGLRKAHFPNWILKKYLTGKEREEF